MGSTLLSAGKACMAMAAIGLLAGSLSFSTAVAQDVNPQVSEAAAFFAKLAENTANPVISAMARENLSKLTDTSVSNSPAPSRRTKARVVVPLLEQPDLSLTVPTMIDGKVMATFLVDTGASYTVITPRMARKLGIAVTDETPRITMTTANGPVRVPLVTLRNVSIGRVSVPEVKAVIQDLGNDVLLSGLLGMNFFQGMDMSISQDSLILNVPVASAR